jgi:hypothetical protein
MRAEQHCQGLGKQRENQEITRLDAVEQSRLDQYGH